MSTNTHTNRVWSDCETPLGLLTLTASDRGLDGLFFPGQEPQIEPALHRPERFESITGQLREYFTGVRRSFEVDLDLSRGTAFQQSVWRELGLIPYGTTISYGELAARLGRPEDARAVAAAVGRTPLPIIVPCHRVIASDGKLTGYLGGLQRKRALLDLESQSRGGAPDPSRT